MSILLIKFGGSKSLNTDSLAKDIANFDKRIIIVHGANEYLKDISEKQNFKHKTILSPSGFSSRYTTKETIDIFLQAYTGLVNKRVVGSLIKEGVNAVGLSGIDGKLWQAKKKDMIMGKVLEDESSKLMAIRDSMTGKVTNINKNLITILLENNYVPVITAPAITEEGEIVNVDNDRACAVMIRDLNIREMVSLFAAPGMLKNYKDESTLISKINKDKIDDYYGLAKGNMKKKLLGAKEAFSNGLEKMYFGDGRIEQPISKALSGNGTVIS